MSRMGRRTSSKSSSPISSNRLTAEAVVTATEMMEIESRRRRGFMFEFRGIEFGYVAMLVFLKMKRMKKVIRLFYPCPLIILNI